MGRLKSTLSVVNITVAFIVASVFLYYLISEGGSVEYRDDNLASFYISLLVSLFVLVYLMYLATSSWRLRKKNTSNSETAEESKIKVIIFLLIGVLWCATFIKMWWAYIV